MPKPVSINLFERSFIDFYDKFVPTEADFSLCRSIFSNILSRPNQLNFLKNKLNLPPVNGYRVTDLTIDNLIVPPHSFVVYYDEDVHNGAGKRLFRANELRDSPTRAEIIKQLMGCFVTDLVPTTINSIGESISTSYVRIGTKSYWVEYRAQGWMSNYTAEFTTRLLSAEEVERDWKPQQIALSKAKPILAKAPLSSIDFVKDVRSGQVFALDFNLAPKIGETAISQVLSGEACWEEIARYVSDNLDSLYDYLLISNELPDWVKVPEFRLTEIKQLRYLPAGTYWECLEDGSFWKYLHGLRDSERYFWRQKSGSGQTGLNQLNRNQIFSDRTYRLV